MTFDIRNSVILITVRGHGSHAAEIVILYFITFLRYYV